MKNVNLDVSHSSLSGRFAMRASRSFRSSAVATLALAFSACGEQGPPSVTSVTLGTQVEGTAYDLVSRDRFFDYRQVASNAGGRLYTLGVGQQSSVLVKYDAELNKQWSRTFAYGGRPSAVSVVADNQGYAYVVGTTNWGDRNWGSSLVRYDPSGRVVYALQNKGIFWATANNSGNAYVLSYSRSTGEYAIAKLSSTGQTLWKTSISQDLGYISSLSLDDQGNAYVVSQTSLKWLLLKFSNSTGTQLLNKENTLDTTLTSSVVKAGRIYLDLQRFDGDELRAFDLNGNLLWKATVDQKGYGQIRMAADADGNVYSLVTDNGDLGDQPHVEKRNRDGALISATRYEFSTIFVNGNQRISNLAVGQAGRLYVIGGEAGSSGTENPYPENGFIARLKP